ncbi:MAG: ACT domain-containing protein [Prolixibacteraceae bacterium]|nr:ACT domain-containing protein [Prolixibacteraceae bacterium]MBN2650227.1 ACT domain-containing protein [Prolixibacteraceae bacterium]
MKQKNHTVIELIVNNHPGVMSHITGLFSRRGYNLEGILCGAIGQGATSVMFLLVRKNEQYQQVLLQLNKLNDVIELKEREDYDHTVFNRIGDLF